MESQIIRKNQFVLLSMDKRAIKVRLQLMRVALNSQLRLTNLWPSDSGSNWNLEVLVFEERGKPEYPEKNLSDENLNQQQTQPTYDAESGNRTRATLVGGECFHHCAIPALLRCGVFEFPWKVFRMISCLLYKENSCYSWVWDNATHPDSA